ANFQEGSIQNVKAWLTTICLNLARSEGRSRSRHLEEVPIERVEHLPAQSRDVFDQVHAALARDEIETALGALPAEQRIAIVLMDLVGHTASEVAAILNCPRGTVLARVHRGRRRLAASLIERGLGRDVL
ncbi:MAG: RNA polymerase sigma factor, partial [Acidimicrobiales bacterium]